MACFSPMLRRASSSVVPFAIRSSRSLKTFHGVAAASDIGGNQRGGGSRMVLQFSTKTEAAKVGQRGGEENVKPAINGIVSEQAINRIVSEKNVKRAINRIVSEIDRRPTKKMAAPEELSPLEVVVEYPDDPDHPDSFDVFFKWECGDEIIKVSPWEVNYRVDDVYRMNLVVTVTKRGCEVQLEFDVNVYLDELSITGLSLNKKVMEDDSGSGSVGEEDKNYEWEDGLSYRGPHNLSTCKVVDENFLKDLLFYLEVRGFNLSTTKFFHDHMKNRHWKSTDKDHMDWLKNLKRFLEY